ncbi:pseudouridine synthase [Hansschlegelia plantiphila]|uniref:Pseudouridine synthase n=1 Tax=Hansschlegelia plantiphila TaxID=374655 RepID=A0A9W6J1K8_9HYPH|nr:pseudouridine synthase [Hansschlegelia plantiphila]GLK67699.1 hypothetical protein GCM10008179_13370 [Hansschlegelia plantiphila]
MTEPTETPDAAEKAAPQDHAPTHPGERLAKAIARAGLGSRRDAEVWIGEGRVKVNGKVVESAALNVVDSDRIEVDGRALPARERTRLWLYHKPRGYVTTNRDPEGRETVFSVLPAGLPRVMTVGRLDINTEGLLLLTNDGGLARVLELPETGWLRRYRVRAFGRVTQEALASLKDGVTIDGFSYGPIEAELERQQNDNVWLQIGLREGKNREVKRLAEHLGLAVNRLIRISFGPFQLGALAEGEAEEVRTRTLMDQLGKRLTEESGAEFEAPVAHNEEAPRMTGGRGAGRAPTPEPRADKSRLADPSQRVGRRAPISRPREMAPPAEGVAAEDAPARVKRGAPIADRRGRKVAVERVSRTVDEPAPKRVSKRDANAAERFGAAGRPARPPRAGAKPAGAKPADARPPRREDGPREDRPARAPYGDRPARAPYGDRPSRPPSGDRPVRAPYGDKPSRAPHGERPSRPPSGDRPARAPYGDRPARGERPYAPRPPRDDARPDRPARAPYSDRTERPRSEAPRAAPQWRDDAAPRAVTERPQRERPSPQGERPPRREWKDRPTNGRPARSEGGRPPRRAPGDAPERPRSDRPQGDRPARAPRGEGAATSERPARREWRDRPAGGKPEGGRPARSGDRPKAGERPTGAAGRVAGKPRPSGGGFKPGGPGGKPRPGGAGKGRPSGGGKGRPGGGADRRR